MTQVFRVANRLCESWHGCCRRPKRGRVFPKLRGHRLSHRFPAVHDSRRILPVERRQRSTRSFGPTTTNRLPERCDMRRLLRGQVHPVRVGKSGGKVFRTLDAGSLWILRETRYRVG